MTDTFDRALTDVFGGRESSFSGSLRGLLRQLYERGARDAKKPSDGGKLLRSLEDMHLGMRFSNGFLRSQKRHRVVTGINRRADGTVESVATNLVEDDGTLVSRDERFQHKFKRHGPYRSH